MSEVELQDSILRHALELQRLSANEEAEALRIMAELEADLKRLLAVRSLSDASKREITALIAEAEKAINARYLAIGQQVDVRGIVLVVAEKTVATLKDVMPVVLMPSQAVIDSLADDILIEGSPSSAWWARQAEDTRFKFAAEVRQGVLNGETNEQITARIVGRRGEPGIMDVQRRHVRSLIHSSVMSASNQARLATFRKNSRHMDGVRWLATLDSRTCLQCAALDGQAWDLEGKPLKGTTVDFQLPPAHWACRCVASPLPKSLDKVLGVEGLDDMLAATRTRASKDGPTTATTFSEFLKRQDKAFVEEMLGEERAQLWQAGKITLKDLVSGSGRPLTLEQIKAR